MKTSRFSSALALLLAIPAASCGWMGEDPRTAAQDAFRSGDFKSARLNLIKLLKDTPQDYASRAMLAEILIKLGDGLAAQAALERLPQDTLQSGENAALMAHAKLLQNDAEGALEWADKAGEASAHADWVRIGALLAAGREREAYARSDEALRRHADYAPILALRGEMALRERRVEFAKRLSAQALKLDGREINALMLAGKIDLEHGNIDAAEGHYADAVASNPAIPGPILALAAVQADAGKLDRAEETLKLLKDVAPAHPIGLFLKAKLAFVEGDLEKAHSTMQAAEKSLRKVPAAQLLMGEIAHLRGQHEQSIAFLRPFMRDNPGHVQGAMVMAQAHLALGETQQAWSILQRPASRAVASPQLLALASRLSRELGKPDPYAARIAKNARPTDLGVRLEEADRAAKRGDWAAAGKIYSDLRKNGMETNALVLNNSAMAALETGNLAEALQLARRAVALTPNDAQVVDTLGWALIKSGENNREALALLRKARNAAPGNLEFRWHYAAALNANGRKAAARKEIAAVRAFADAAQQRHIDALLADL